ncbi:uncharacterized protein LOC131802654 isoform X1 [Musca domestica]|uniref:Uncharacterized protein LOC131802654 isoform X1 n=1 Tax=Musca domestica TaxID=7370 RepID=A0ABM3UZV2_MUSDO|nr:uncharacterized protein LOC131802654 isoform X1 [Musca domestica]
MPQNQDLTRRTSGRSTQGIPPARYNPDTYDMSVVRSPTGDTPTSSHQKQQQMPAAAAAVNTPPANTSKSSSSSSQLQLQKPPSNTPAKTPNPANELAEMRKLMKFEMEDEFLAAQAKMQAQLLNTSQQFASLQNTMSQQALPTLTSQPPIFSNQTTQQPPLNTPQQPQRNLPPQPPLNLPPQPPLSLPPQPPLNLPLHSVVLPPQTVPPTTSQQLQTQVHQLPPLSINTDESFPNSLSNNSNGNAHKKIYPLPIFSGLPEEWQAFFEAYESTTTEFGYSNLHNIMRLRDALKGRARETVESMLGSSANVSAILEILQETFGRPEQLIRSQVEKVRAIPPLADDNLDALVNFANKLSNMATFLKNAKGEHHLSNPSLLSELVSKLPINRQMQWAEKCLQLQHPATIVDFSDWLGILRRLAHMVHDTQPISATSSNRRHTQTQQKKYAYVAVSSSCPICQGECNNIKICPHFLKMTIDDRWNKIKQIKTCFCCLKRGHQLKNCHYKRRCGINDCQKSHHQLLHKTLATPSQEPNRTLPTHDLEPRTNTPSLPDAPPSQTQRRNCHAAHYTENVLFQILPVTLYGTHKQITTYAFIDDGANVSMLDEDVARELGVHGKPEILKIQWLNNQNINEKTEKINLTISGVVPLEAPRMMTDVGPIITLTRLGAVIYGPIPGEKSSNLKRALHVRKRFEEENCDLLKEMYTMMRQYFDVETLGTKVNVTPILSIDDERALKILRENTKRIDGRYQCPLLWKEHFSPIPESYNLSYSRLQCVEQKMAKDSVYAAQYCKKIRDYEEKGYCRKLSVAERERRSDRTFYLPHFGVKNPNKDGIRIVFDAAAEVQQFSLNKALLPGPDINNSLISILFKFREFPVAVCGDIQEMFHQIVIAKEDQDSQRFLWRNGDPSQPLETYVMERMIFGATCSPTIAQYVKNLNARRFINESPRAVQGIIDRHYVDDYVDCFQTEGEAVEVVRDVIKIHKEGGFNLRNIKSNSLVLQRMFGNPISDESDGNSIFDDGMERVLGIHWLPKSDVFCFELKLHKVDEKILKLQKVPTKREMLSLNMSVFDPFGFLGDFMVTSKIIMQNVWKSGIKWDEKLPSAIYSRWKTWLEELPKLKDFKVPRCYSNGFFNGIVDLHVFVDASEDAMAAVAYWRIVTNCGVSVVFVMGKTSCAPTRYHTIPKLELQAAVIGVRMKENILENHLKNINNIYFWSDSSTVISWIRSEHRTYKQYVANRVSEILESSRIEQWRWCPGAENPADEGTRAKGPKKYQPEGRWKNGPEFLRKEEKYWPDEEQIGTCVDHSKTELRNKYKVLVACQVCFCIPDINRFSKYRRLKRAMAWTFRFVENMKRKSVVSGDLTVEEEARAEMYLCRCVQQEVHGDEILDIQRTGSVSANSSIKSLNPQIGSDGLLRVSGRIENAVFLSLDTRRPIILHKGHRFTLLLVEFYHSRFCHINVATTMSEIRLRFWIPSLRQLLRSVQSRCLVCKIRKAKPIQPQMAPLPLERVTPYVRAFTYTGLDYFGPVTVSIRRQREKRWVALFTCLTVRAVHLEIATDLSSDSCLMCIRNFINRRGVPEMIRSDNGTNFVGIAKELQGITNFLDTNSVSSGLTALGIKWVYNTPVNPSEGGVWERLVQSVKKALYIMLKEQAPKLETLQAFLIEAENMVNSRPLTHLPVTPEDPDPLTPNHFLLGCTNSTQTPAPFEPRLMCLRKQWRVTQNLKNGMWHQWLREYLPELTRRTKWCLPSRSLDVGCLVFVCDPEMARSQWSRGRVIEVFRGKDGVARSAKVRTSAGVYHRPVSKLAILDVVAAGDGVGEASPSGSVHGGGDVGDGNPAITKAKKV